MSRVDTLSIVKEDDFPQKLHNFACNLLSTCKYLLVDFWTNNSEPSLANFPLLNCGIWHVLLLITCYLYFTFIWGPRFMKNRQPFDLRYVMIAHNLFLVLVNAGGLIAALPGAHFGLIVFECRRLNPAISSADRMLVTVGWIFYISKYVDFLDTVYFVLRKKTSHVTGLHVFHHAIMPLLCFLFMKLTIYSNTAIIPLINSFVHSVMYTYYALSALGPHMQKYLWWKHYITILQLTQFVMCGVHAFYMLVNNNCECPRIYNFVQLSQAIFFFRLFYSFYRAAYEKKINHKHIDLNANDKESSDKAITVSNLKVKQQQQQQQQQDEDEAASFTCNSDQEQEAGETDQHTKKSL